MQKHTKVYFEYFGYDESDFINCEVCSYRRAVDIHHIIPRSKFGKKTKDAQDNIYNLIAVCRECHDKAHSNEITKEELQDIHRECIELR